MLICWPSPRNITERTPNLIQTSLHNKLPEQGPTSTQLHNEKITNTCTWTERHVQLCKRQRERERQRDRDIERQRERQRRDRERDRERDRYRETGREKERDRKRDRDRDRESYKENLKRSSVNKIYHSALR